MQTAIKISPVNTEKRKEIGIKPGDTVRVWQKIEEKGKTRLQAFEGLVLARKHGNEAGGTFTVRRVSSGVGVEKIFPLYSPLIDKIEIVRRSKMRRAKLYYIREKVAREIKRQMRNMKMVEFSTGSDIEEKEATAKAEEEAQQAAEATEQAKQEQESEVKEGEVKAEEEREIKAESEEKKTEAESPQEKEKEEEEKK